MCVSVCVCVCVCAGGGVWWLQVDIQTGAVGEGAWGAVLH